jgi:hypothetical protein
MFTKYVTTIEKQRTRDSSGTLLGSTSVLVRLDSSGQVLLVLKDLCLDTFKCLGCFYTFGGCEYTLHTCVGCWAGEKDSKS